MDARISIEMKLFALLLCLAFSLTAVSCAKRFNHSYQISKEYDQSDDRTYFRLQRIRVMERNAPYQFLDFSPYVVRSARANEDAAYLLFYGSDRTYYKDSDHLGISFAGEKIDLIPQNFGRSVSQDTGAVLLYQLSLDKFQRVVNAANVDMTLGAAHFQMNADQLEAEKDVFESRLEADLRARILELMDPATV
ncbi:MAG TPA: hypothetical protein VGL29_10175 [Blastocatellia bacterium]